MLPALEADRRLLPAKARRHLLPALEADRLLLPAKAMRLLEAERSQSRRRSRLSLATARLTPPAPAEDRWRGRLQVDMAYCPA